ncbi:MAG: hypothetical protein ABIB43_00245 [archaeon]
MSKLIPIDEVQIIAFDIERTLNSKEHFKFHPKVIETYLKKGYDERPKSKEEAEKRGEKGFNGLTSSFPVMEFHKRDNKTWFYGYINPTRYLFGEAFRDLMKEENYSKKEINAMSPNMANVSLIAPVKIDGKYFIFSQIKGDALGSGQVHAGYVAGNIAGKHVMKEYEEKTERLLINALKQETYEEAGMNLSSMDSTAPAYFVDERETGQVNLASVVRNANVDSMLKSYEAQTIEKLLKAEKLEVNGIAMLPILGVSLIPIEGRHNVENIVSYRPTTNGLVKTVENRGIRPYTRIVLEHLAESKDNVKSLLEKAGF